MVDEDMFSLVESKLETAGGVTKLENGLSAN